MYLKTESNLWGKFAGIPDTVELFDDRLEIDLTVFRTAKVSTATDITEIQI